MKGIEQLSRIYLNDDWDFFTEKRLKSDMTEIDYTLEEQERNKETVRLPHTFCETPYHYFDESIYQMVCSYVKKIKCEAEWKDKCVLLTIEAAAHKTKLFVNGKICGQYLCGYTAIVCDISEYISYGEENEIRIQVDSRETSNIPPFGKVVDYMTYGGIYREVYLDIKPKSYIKDVFPKTYRSADGSWVLDTDVCVSANAGIKDKILQILYDEEGKKVAEFPEGEKKHVLSDIAEWNTEAPVLYTLETKLTGVSGVIDSYTVRVGFREAVFKPDGFYLNGKKIKLRGLNRHQSYPYVGYAMPKSMQRYDADILKSELGVNAVRTSHYPQSHHFLDRCDELGLLVFTEIPGWQYIGDADWKKQAVINTGDMVKQYRNHPSIILWGVRINESQDDDALYTATNETAHRLDPTRQTSGVRCIQGSSLLEDVYAYNDFSHEGNNAGCRKKEDITSDRNKGYLISEYNGHMFPTKSYDTEEHRVEHMLRHARVMDAYYSKEDIAGGFGWCMFDYNTHQDFGSGDRICYHGVCDMFRNPKLAAYLYRSQNDENPVLEISSSMDIGEHPACLMKDVYAVTNADSVRLYKNNVFIREFKAEKKKFGNLPHPPIVIDDIIGNQMEACEGFSRSKSEDIKKVLMSACKNGMGNLPLSTKLLAAKCIVFRGMKLQDAVELYNKYIGNWGGKATEYRFEAVKDGKVTETVVKKPMKKGKLEVVCSHNVLHEENTYDVAAIRIRAVSEEGNVLNFGNEPVVLETEGDIKLIGPETIVLNGGMGGTYVKTTGKKGMGKLKIKSENFGEKTLEFTIQKD